MTKEQYERFKQRARQVGLYLDRDEYQKFMEDVMKNPSARVNYFELMRR